MADVKGSTSSDPDIHALHKEWDEASCPICMDHPHNCVLLICTSHDKGCRSYICDTSYRHSNCLDRFRKLRVEEHSDNSTDQPLSSFHESSLTERVQGNPHAATSEPSSFNPGTRSNPMEIHEGMSEAFEENNNIIPDRILEDQVEEQGNLEEFGSRSTSEQNCLKCPLCRGRVMGWMIVKEARQHLDSKPRSCSRESCSFSGNYGELRRHARRAHPAVRPADVDPARQRAWRHLEHQREYGDILSAIRSAMPGAIVLGDYVIDDGDGMAHDRELGDVSGPWWATLFLFHMMSSPARSRDEFLSSSRTWRSHLRSSRQRYLWGENLLGLQDEDVDDDDDDIMIPRRRRRFTRSRPEDERP